MKKTVYLTSPSCADINVSTSSGGDRFVISQLNGHISMPVSEYKDLLNAIRYVIGKKTK